MNEGKGLERMNGWDRKEWKGDEVLGAMGRQIGPIYRYEVESRMLKSRRG